MLERPGLNLRTATAVNVISGYLALIAVRGYSPLLVLVPIIVLSLERRGEELERRYPFYQKLSQGVTVLACLLFAASFAVLTPIGALVGLIIYIQSHLLLHLKQERHYYYIYLMTFFLVLAAAVQSPEPIIALALFLFVLGSAWALSALRITADRAYAREHAAPELISLRARRAVELETVNARRSIIAIVSACAVLILLMTSLFFVITPRVEAGFLGRDTTMARLTGLPKTVDLQSGSYVLQDPTPVMQVELPDDDGARFPLSEMYWRVATLPNYNDSAWTRKGLDRHYYEGVENLFAENMSEFRRMSRNSPHELVRSPMPGNYRLVQQRIFSDNLPADGIPALDLPLRIQVEGRAADKRVIWEGRNDVTARISQGKDNQLDYTVWSEILNPSTDRLRETTMEYRMTEEDLEMLLHHDLLRRTVDLAQRITEQHTNPYDKVVAIERYFSGNGFVYSLDIPPMPSDHAIDFFIHEAKQGHCEFFASAMALMVRSIGIPTRVVSGFRGGEWNPNINAYIVRQSMAHLWVEAYFQGYGWVRFDPAPPSIDNTQMTTLMLIVQRLNDLQLRAKLFWFREVISFDRGLQIERLRALPRGIVRSLGFGRQFDEATATQRADVRPRYIMGLALGAVLLFGMGGMLALVLRRRKEAFPLTREQRQAVALYTQLRQRLAKAGVTVAGLSAEELQREVSSRGLAEAADIQEMLRLYNEVRFGQRRLPRGRMEALLRGLRRLQPRTG
jgi:hypothetical protein